MVMVQLMSIRRDTSSYICTFKVELIIVLLSLSSGLALQLTEPLQDQVIEMALPLAPQYKVVVSLEVMVRLVCK